MRTSAFILAVGILAFPAMALADGLSGEGQCDPDSDYGALVRAGEGGGAGYSATNGISTATGAYQFLHGTLKELGYVKMSSPTPPKGEGAWSGVQWTGKDGINSRAEFMASTGAQDNALKEFTQNNLNQVSGTYTPGEKVNGIPMTDGGAAYATHMLGAGGFKKWAASGFSPSGLDAKIAADHNWTQEQYNDHLMGRVAQGGCYDPGDIEGGGGSDDVDDIPTIFLMPWVPDHRPPVILPGQLRSLST